ncbi:MAG TPA: 7TM diverse intracellular signaling domain-containing protein [Cytophagaceae bacterium]|nr:7TM diverse intracellular signaling domain-containing protein [Cytophagaceae bacterium]
MRKNIFLCFLMLSHFALHAADKDSAIVYKDPEKIQKLSYNVYSFEDTSTSLPFEAIRKNDKFQLVKLEVPNFGVKKSVFWLKFNINNQTDEDHLLLQLSYPLMDEADLYIVNNDGTYSVIKAGDTHPFSERKYKNQNFIYDIDIHKNETKTFFMKIRSTEQILVPLYVSTREPLIEANTFTDIVVGIYIGIIFVMFFYNAFIYLTVKDTNYLYYIIYILFIGLTQITLLGYSSKLLWPENMWLASHGLYIVASLGSSAIVIFMNRFLNMKYYTPRLRIGVYIIVSIYTAAILAALVDQQSISYNLIDINGILITFFSLFVAIKISIKGYKPARYFLLGWTAFLIGVLVFVLRSFGVFPYNNFTNYTMPIGSAVEVIMLSLALADRINVFKKEKEESQAQALEALRENERIIRTQNIVLEGKVEERTSALKKSNSELMTTLTELKQTQSQLVNAEKMASLGQLTAGIAHEINNPINFVVSNVKPLQRDIEDIHELVNKYQDLKNGEQLQEKIEEINKFRKEIDYDYIKEEISGLLKGIEEGASRTADIVKGLRVFSRLDENDLKKTNIVDGIESTLTLLNPELSGSIDVVKNYNKIPDIECFPGKMNQVFMNILNNAIFAIKANKDRKEKGKLVISTSADDKYVTISIKDNGTGMTEEVKTKVFEPFFTTKDVGKGTGLGMSITFSIIEDHHGLIELNSEYGQGTEFVIKLPVKQGNN